MDRAVPQIPTMLWPNQGAKGLPVSFDFSKTTTYTEDTVFEQQQGLIEFIQTVFIDNSLNSKTFTLTTFIGGVQINIVAEPNSQGFYPCVTDTGPFRFIGASAGGVIVQVVFMNVAVPYVSWGPVTVDMGGNQPFPAQGIFTDRSGNVAAGGVSQALMAANPNRKRIIIENPGSATGQNIAAAESLFFNFTSAAGVNTGASIELLPGGSYDSESGPVSTEALTVNAATSGHLYTAKEM